MNKIKELFLKIILLDEERNKKGKPSILSYLALIISLLALLF